MSFYKTLDRIKKKSIIIINKDKEQEINKMDAYKKDTIRDYTKWDIKSKWVCPMKNEHEMRKKITRKARRNAKQELKKNCNEF